MLYLDFQDFVVNTMLILMRYGKDTRISYNKLGEYVDVVTDTVNRDGRNIMTCMTEDDRDDFLYDYSSYFYEKDINDVRYIYLSDGVSAHNLRSNVVRWLPVDIVIAFFSKEASEVLLKDV